MSAINPAALPVRDRFMEINTGGNNNPSRWIYDHMTPGNSTATNKVFAFNSPIGAKVGIGNGKTVNNMTPIGGVTSHTNAAFGNHLHLGYGEGADPWKADPGGHAVFRPTKDPLDLLTAIGDTVDPTVRRCIFAPARGISSGR